MNDIGLVSNRVYDELEIGESASLTRMAGRDDIDLFATVSGAMARLPPESPESGAEGRPVLPGFWPSALVSAVLVAGLPGPGTRIVAHAWRNEHPVAPGDVVTATVTVKDKRPDGLVVVDCTCTNQDGAVVLTGTAEVIAPRERIVRPQTTRPEVHVRRHDRYQAFIKEAQTNPPLATAVVHPCNPESIIAAIEARDEGLILPTLVGPEHKIRAAAEAANVSLAGLVIEPTEHSHAAAEKAAQLAAGGLVHALMKGSLHTHELLSVVVSRESGLRTDRWISHVFAMDVPAYPKPLFVTDAAINIAPNLEQKRDICQNAIDLLVTLGDDRPMVAVLAAVETVDPQMQSTIDAAALTAMAVRGQITGGIVDGPLAFDNAVSPDAARIKEIRSPVAGQADVLLVPDIEAGNILAKQLIYFAGADAAGIVLGARVPIMLTSRSDTLRVRLASAALAGIVAARRKREAAERVSVR